MHQRRTRPQAANRGSGPAARAISNKNYSGAFSVAAPSTGAVSVAAAAAPSQPLQADAEHEQLLLQRLRWQRPLKSLPRHEHEQLLLHESLQVEAEHESLQLLLQRLRWQRPLKSLPRHEQLSLQSETSQLLQPWQPRAAEAFFSPPTRATPTRAKKMATPKTTMRFILKSSKKTKMSYRYRKRTPSSQAVEIKAGPRIVTASELAKQNQSSARTAPHIPVVSTFNGCEGCSDLTD